MTLPKISIIIPSYNKGKFIAQTLQSIVDQDYPDLEVIVQDGGSTDESLGIIKKFAKKHKFIKWESKKDKGQLDAINKGLKKAKGDVLTYINADDFYEDGAFNKVAIAYKKNPNALWFAGQGKVIDETGSEIAKWVSKYKNFLLRLNSYTFLLVVNYMMQPSVFIAKKAYKKYGPFTGKKGIVYEYDMWLKLGGVQMPVITNDTLSSFRLYSEGLSSSKANLILQDDENIAKKYTRNGLVLIFHRMNNYARHMVNKGISAK